VKRAFDLLVGGALLLVSAPVTAVIALLTRVLDGPPAFFRQARSGRGGRPFTMVKIRTMRPPRPHEKGPEHDEARLTHLGRMLRATSLDELPTFWHVVRGQMSLVGPRPLPVAYLHRYTDEQARRLEVRPGVTGWAQVNGRNTTSWAQRLAMDVWYVDHASLRLDLRILARTVAVVLRRDGVDQAEGVTMTEFRGAAEADA
jgi:lipopolysaccharide/colanic/teichoic acid biosynthesis glycosyltransferase